jgi:hypothetical protein
MVSEGTGCNTELSITSLFTQIKKVKRATYLKMEMSHSQEWLGKVVKKHTPANSHATQTIDMEILETF